MSGEMSAEARRAARFGITAAAPAPSTTSAAPSSSSQHQHQSNDFHNNNRRGGDGGPYRRQGYGGHNNHRRDMTNAPPPTLFPHHHHHRGGAFPPPPSPSHHQYSQHHNAPPPGSAAFNREHDRKRKPMTEYDETCAVRVGVLDARRAITEQDILSEIEQMRLASKIEAIFIEVLSDQDGKQDEEEKNKDEAAALIRAHEATKKMLRNEVIEGEPQLEPKSGKRIQWARVFMSNPDVADMVATEFAFPGAQFKWTLIVQRLPIIDHFGELIKDGTASLNQQFVNNIYQPVQNCPIPQIIVVDAQEGYIPFMTTELFHTKGCQDYFFLKEQKNVLLRRSACKHYDPHAGSDCFYGVNCSFVHIHTAVMDRLLRVQSFKTALRMGSRRAEDVLTTNWESERRNDTLVFRDVPEKIGLKELCFMFSGCEGYMNAILRYSPHDNRRHGIIRFSSRQDAFLAMSQTFGSGYNISFFGVLEDLRAIRIKEQLAEEEEEKKKRAQEKEERVALARERYERQQQQQGHEGGGADKDSAAAAGYTSKKFGGGENNSDGVPRESGQRRQRDHEEEQQKFQVERRDSDNDNDNDNKNQAETNDDKNRYDDDNDNNNDHHSSPARSARSPSSAGARSSSYASSSSSSVGSSNSSGGNDDDDNANDGADKHRRIGMKAKASEKDFPELPEGWDWGFSRKTNQYYFYEKNKKNKTTFKHPTTSSGYRSGGEQY